MAKPKNKRKYVEDVQRLLRDYWEAIEPGQAKHETPLKVPPVKKAVSPLKSQETR